MSGAFFAILLVHLHFPDSGSLKAKRAELNAVKAALRQRLGASVAEVGHQDSWQRSTLAAAVCGRSQGAVEEAADGIQRWLDARFDQGAYVERRIASWSDLESIA